MAMMKRGDEPINRSQANAYIEGHMDEAMREDWEQLLLEDEESLASYMEMLDELQEELPSLENSSAFTERVMGDWAKMAESSAELEQVAVEEGGRRYRWYEKTIFHYAVAASLTLLIMSSGMFDKLHTGQMELMIPKKDNSPSFSEQVIQATSGWLDQLMGSRK
jgi:replicative superfamily II helicase